MKVINLVFVSALISLSVFAADVSHVFVGAGHNYPGKPDSEEKMFMGMLMKKQSSQGLGVLRADSPYPKRIQLIDRDDFQEEYIAFKHRKDSHSSCASIATIVLDTPIEIKG